MSETNEQAVPEARVLKSQYEENVAKFLNTVDEPKLQQNSSDLWDCLWRVAPRGEGGSATLDRENWEVLRYELARLGADAAETLEVQKELKGAMSIHRSLREGLVELLTDLYFPGADAWTTEPAPFAEDLLRGLERNFQRAGESPDAGRMHAISVLRDLLRQPERYEEVRELAGLSAGQDSGVEARSDMTSGQSSGFFAPVLGDESDISSLEQPPIVPEEIYLGGEDAWPRREAWGKASRKQPKHARLSAPEDSPSQHPDSESQHDSAHQRDLRHKRNE